MSDGYRLNDRFRQIPWNPSQYACKTQQNCGVDIASIDILKKLFEYDDHKKMMRSFVCCCFIQSFHHSPKSYNNSSNNSRIISNFYIRTPSQSERVRNKRLKKKSGPALQWTQLYEWTRDEMQLYKNKIAGNRRTSPGSLESAGHRRVKDVPLIVGAFGSVTSSPESKLGECGNRETQRNTD